MLTKYAPKNREQLEISTLDQLVSENHSVRKIEAVIAQYLTEKEIRTALPHTMPNNILIKLKAIIIQPVSEILLKIFHSIQNACIVQSFL